MDDYENAIAGWGVGQRAGAKPLAPSHYFARLSQRLINALTAPTAEGRLYEIDMRLRPSGQSGPIATPLAGFRRYQEEDAWTWEHMALTRARVVSGAPAFARRIEAALRDIVCQARDPDRLVTDVADMRQRIDREFAARSLWDVKYLRGGLVDLEFLADRISGQGVPFCFVACKFRHILPPLSQYFSGT